MNRYIYFLLLGMVSNAIYSPTSAQTFTKQKIEQLSRVQFHKIIPEYREFLSLHNDGHYPDQIQTNLQWCVKAFNKRKFSTEVIESGGVPFVLAQRNFAGNKKTVLFYLQIDGQPVDPAKWSQPDPFQAVLKESNADGLWHIIDWNLLAKEINPTWKIFARSSSDSKGPAMTFMAALDIMNEQMIKPDFNIKVIMDFQEEMSSPQLPKVVMQFKEKLTADMLVVMDGTRHLSNEPTLMFGARGIATVSLKVFGGFVPLHSGQYGNYAPNPVFGLSRILAGMKDEDGRVTIPGYYDGITLSESDKTIMNDVPEDQHEIVVELGISSPEKIGGTYQEALAYPTLNVRGLQAAWVGDESRTIIPSEALAELDIRLVPESDADHMIELIRKYIVDLGYHFVDGLPTVEERAKYDKLISFKSKVGYKAYRTPYNSPIDIWLTGALTRTFGKKPVRMRTTGGSQPISPFITTLDLPAVSVRIPNPDNNIHSPDENIRVGNFLEGIQTCVGILTESIQN